MRRVNICCAPGRVFLTYSGWHIDTVICSDALPKQCVSLLLNLLASFCWNHSLYGNFSCPKGSLELWLLLSLYNLSGWQRIPYSQYLYSIGFLLGDKYRAISVLLLEDGLQTCMKIHHMMVFFYISKSTIFSHRTVSQATLILPSLLGPPPSSSFLLCSFESSGYPGCPPLLGFPSVHYDRLEGSDGLDGMLDTLAGIEK